MEIEEEGEEEEGEEEEEEEAEEKEEKREIKEEEEETRTFPMIRNTSKWYKARQDLFEGLTDRARSKKKTKKNWLYIFRNRDQKSRERLAALDHDMLTPLDELLIGVIESGRWPVTTTYVTLPFYGDRPGAYLQLTLGVRVDRSEDRIVATLELDLSHTSFHVYPDVTVVDMALDMVPLRVPTWSQTAPTSTIGLKRLVTFMCGATYLQNDRTYNVQSLRGILPRVDVRDPLRLSVERVVDLSVFSERYDTQWLPTLFTLVPGLLPPMWITQLWENLSPLREYLYSPRNSVSPLLIPIGIETSSTLTLSSPPSSSPTTSTTPTTTTTMTMKTTTTMKMTTTIQTEAERSRQRRRLIHSGRDVSLLSSTSSSSSSSSSPSFIGTTTIPPSHTTTTTAVTRSVAERVLEVSSLATLIDIMGIAGSSLPSVSTAPSDARTLLRRRCCERHRNWEGCLSLLFNQDKSGSNPMCVGLCRSRLLVALYTSTKEYLIQSLKENTRHTFIYPPRGIGHTLSDLFQKRYTSPKVETEREYSVRRVPWKYGHTPFQYKFDSGSGGSETKRLITPTLKISPTHLSGGGGWTTSYGDTSVHDMVTLSWKLSLRTSSALLWTIKTSEDDDSDEVQWEAILQHRGLTDEIRSLLSTWRWIDLSRGQRPFGQRPVTRRHSSLTDNGYKTDLSVTPPEVLLQVQLLSVPSPSIPRPPPGQSDIWSRLVAAVPSSIRPDFSSQWQWLEPFLYGTCV